MDNKLIIPGAIILAGVIVAGALLYSNLRKNPLPARPAGGLDKEGKGEVGGDFLKIQKADFVLGSPAAKVAIIEYGDFQCPFCGRFFQTTEKQILEAYVKTGKAAFLWRDFAFLGEESFRAAQASRCAGEQGKFWDYHDKLFNSQNGENKGAFADTNLKSFATAFGLDQNKFNSCFDSGKYKKAVEDSTAGGQSVGVSGTPATFVNGRLISGAQPFSVFQKVIDEELKK